MAQYHSSPFERGDQMLELARRSTGRLALLSLGFVVSACSGSPLAQQAPNPGTNVPAALTKAAAQTNCLALACLYVSTSKNKVLVFPTNANGNASPVQAIEGTHTGLDQPSAVAVDGNHNIYVANAHASSVTVYAAGATGDATPIQTISGTSTGLSEPAGIALDSNGNIYVVDGP